MASVQAGTRIAAPVPVMPGDRAAIARPRVLRVITRLNVGGPARQELDLSHLLHDGGFDTRLVWGSAGVGEAELAPGPGIAATHVPALTREVAPTRDLVAAHAIHGVMRRWRPDVVHTHMAKAGVLGRAAAISRGTPAIVHTFHGHVLQHYFSALRNEAFASIERALARRTHALVAVSPSVRDDLLAMGIGDADRWHVLPVGLDLDPFLAERATSRDARRRLGLPMDDPLVVTAGRLTAIKDHRTLLRAMARLVAVRPDAGLVIAGDGELRASLEAEAARLLPGRVRFFGWSSDLPTLYRAADVVASTSTMEGTPLSLIEASAAGRPVVATDVGGVADVIVDGTSGLLVPRGDDAAAAGALGRVVGDPVVAEAMGRAGRAWVAPRFSRERLADDVRTLYVELLARSRPSARTPSR